MEEKKKLLLIINPVAGRAEVRHNLVPVLEIFESAGYMVTVFVTGKSGDASDIIFDTYYDDSFEDSDEFACE